MHRYLVVSFIGPLVLTFLIVLFIMIMQFLWKYIDDLVGKGLDFYTIGELLFYFGLSFIPMSLPLAILLASLMTFGDLGENMELTAIKSAGVSLQRFLRPLIVLVVLISIAAFYFSNNILPITNLKSRALLYDIQRQRPEFNIKAGQFYNGIEGYSIKIAEKNLKTNLLKNILIYDHTEKAGNISVTYADSGYMRMTPDEQTIVLTLYNGYSYTEVQDGKNKRKRIKDRSYPQRKDQFQKEIVMLKLTGFGLNRTDENLFKSNYSMLNIQQLEYATDSLSELLVKRKELSNNTLRKSQLFAGVQRLKKFHNDSIRKSKDEYIDTSAFLPKEILKELSQREQESYVDRALTRARSTKNFIITSKNTILAKEKRIRRYKIEFHRKFTLSFACFIFFFIGAPLGAIIRKGGLGMPIVVSILFFLFYHITSMTGEKFVRQDVLDPFTGMWLSTFFLLPIGVFLTIKSTNDSAILDINTYLEWPRKLLERYRKVNSNSE